MIKKRIIPKILLGTSIKSGKIISGTTLKYDTFRITGAPESQAQIYQQTLSDELMIIAPRNQTHKTIGTIVPGSKTYYQFVAQGSQTSIQLLPKTPMLIFFEKYQAYHYFQ